MANMFGNTIIYKKEYSEQERAEKIIASAAGAKRKQTLAEEYEERINQITIPIENRQAKKDSFISLAKLVSEKYCFDCEIYAFDTKISVTYYFDPQPMVDLLKDLIDFADEINFFRLDSERQIILNVNYYLRAVYDSRTGEKLRP